MSISLVIPCYNEEKSIGPVLDSLPHGLEEVIVVDNNSNDRTAEIAKSKGAKVLHAAKQGYGSAIKVGLAGATCDVIVVIDGDGQYPSDKILDIKNFLSTNKIDFISCSRFPLVNRKVMNTTRKIGNYLLTLVANILFGLKMKDSQSGMWVFKRHVLGMIDLKSDDMEFSEEIKVKAATNGGIVFREYHIDYFPRNGESKLFPLKHGLKNIYYLIKLKLVQISRKQ